jgi:large subunit ribosomal protein L2
MAVKNYKPTSNGKRTRKTIDFSELTSKRPEKRLTTTKSKTNGRNNSGQITVRRRGGGLKRLYRIIDFSRTNKDGIKGKVLSLEYDPNRSANIALVAYSDGEKRYILAADKLKVGQIVENGEDSEIQPGNCLKIKDIPAGTFIHNIALHANGKGLLARSAGSYATLVAKGDKFGNVKLPSGETRLISVNCVATVGVVGNADHRNTQRGKAGISRLKGRRPKVRGTVMNPCDHPHGGGEGKAPIGREYPCSPWGKNTMGMKTRNKKNKSNKYIVNKRK